MTSKWQSWSTTVLMSKTSPSSFTQQALDFLLADVSGYANSLYEELRAKSELTDADIDSAEAIITALYPANLLYPNDDIKNGLAVKQMSDLGINLGNVRDSINALVEESPARKSDRITETDMSS